ncbi:thioredoxin family protein [Flavisolibacter tropicus]|uniref:thioredoxin family protein n=1 Tax=Flavisolibacter tropicus TaxID=1492898 RepID=UPI0008352B97|nr:thioredoxin family protein [Flavisolibacter tropicus]
MKKLFFLFACVLVASNVFAEGIRFVENKKWKEILAQAKRENKLIFLDAYASWCGPCKYMQQKVFTSVSAGSYFNSKFINVKMDMEEGEGVQLSEELNITAYPTLFFVNGNGDVVHKYVGALDVENFVELGKTASNPETQYFTLKNKAAGGKLTPKAFHEWVEKADDMEDEDVDSLVTNYLKVTTYPLVEKEMLHIMLEHAPSLTINQLDILQANRRKAQELLGVTKEDFEKSFLRQVRATALVQSWKNEEIDFAVFKGLITQYFPEKVALEHQKMKVKYYFYKEESEKGLQELLACLKTTSLRLSASELGDLIFAYSDKIAKSNYANEFIKQVEQFTLLPEDINKTYFKDCALLIIYYRLNNKEKVATLSAKILANENTPENLRESVSSLSKDK